MCQTNSHPTKEKITKEREREKIAKERDVGILCVKIVDDLALEACIQW